ncbi:MAG TPA: signal peptidase I [Acidisarcina sp.]
MTEPATSNVPEPNHVRQPISRPLAHHSHRVQLLHATASLLSMIVVALFILTFIAQPFRIPSASMEPTLLVGDFLLVNKMADGTLPVQGHLTQALGYREIQRGDIIVFRYPPDPKIHVVKRVIAIPGDRIHLQRGVVYLDGQPQHESYVAPTSGAPDFFRDQFPAALSVEPRMDPAWAARLAQGIQKGEYLVPAGCYFVMGDNRSNSRDSRYWGLVPRQNIVGSPFLIYFSFRQESLEDVSSLPDDKIDHQKDDSYSMQSFARWDRMFRVVR